MKPPADGPDPGNGPITAADYRNEGIRRLLATFAQGEPMARLPLGHLLGGLRESAFGVFLLVAILPAFVPIPGIGGMVSGPLVILMGVQMLCGLQQPWLPRFIARRGPRYRTLQRFFSKIARPLHWLDRLLKPRLSVLTDPAPARIFTGLLLTCSGILLSLPIPFTNYLFGFQLLLFALALIERDGALMLLNWLGALAATAFFAIGSQQVLVHTLELARGWMGG